MTYAIITLGGKQYRVSEGQKILVDRLSQEEGKTFNPTVLFVGGDGTADLAPKGVTVSARVVGHVLGDKVLVGKYKPKTGYRRHMGHRSKLSQIEITKIGKKETRQAKPKADEAGDEKPARRAKAEAAGDKPARQTRAKSSSGEEQPARRAKKQEE